MSAIPQFHRVARIREFYKPLSIETEPTPKHTREQVLIKVEGAGVCHTDLHVWRGDWKELGLPPSLPIIPSHEISGVVVDIGEKVPVKIRVGQKSLSIPGFGLMKMNTCRKVVDIYQTMPYTRVLLLMEDYVSTF